MSSVARYERARSRRSLSLHSTNRERLRSGLPLRSAERGWGKGAKMTHARRSDSSGESSTRIKLTYVTGLKATHELGCTLRASSLSTIALLAFDESRTIAIRLPSPQRGEGVGERREDDARSAERLQRRVFNENQADLCDRSESDP